MALAAQADVLLREIRELRERRQRQLERDLAEIDRDYHRDLCHMQQRVRNRQLLMALVALSALVAWMGASSFL